MPDNQGLVDSVVGENYKVGAGAPSHYGVVGMKATADTQALQASHIARLNQIAESALAGWVSIHQAVVGNIAARLSELDAIEAMGNAVVGQAGVKAAQSTPPETARPTTGSPGPG